MSGVKCPGGTCPGGFVLSPTWFLVKDTLICLGPWFNRFIYLS